MSFSLTHFSLVLTLRVELLGRTDNVPKKGDRRSRTLGLYSKSARPYRAARCCKSGQCTKGEVFKYRCRYRCRYRSVEKFTWKFISLPTGVRPPGPAAEGGGLGGVSKYACTNRDMSAATSADGAARRLHDRHSCRWPLPPSPARLVGAVPLSPSHGRGLR